MMPYAQTFANEATADELIKSVHILLQEAILAPPDMKITAWSISWLSRRLRALARWRKQRRFSRPRWSRKGRYEGTAYVFAAQQI